MAEIEIGPLGERLSDEEIVELASGLENLGAPRLPKASSDEAVPVGDVEDDVLSEFLDRLEAHDAACEIYLPVEFEGRVEVGDVRVGSAVHLLEVLDEMKDELAIDEEEDEEEDDDEEEGDDEALLEPKLRLVWKLLFEGAQAAVDRHLPLLL
jgi:hypothetical protein